MESDHRPVESERVGMRLNLPPVPMKVARVEISERPQTEVVHFPEPEEAPSPVQTFWQKHGIRYQPSSSAGRPAL